MEIISKITLNLFSAVVEVIGNIVNQSDIVI